MNVKTAMLISCSFLCCWLVAGCIAPGYTETERAQQYAELKVKVDAKLNSFKGNLTATKLLMIASAPAERIAVGDGEVWVYRYYTGGGATTTTLSGNGGLFSPYQAVSTTSASILQYEMKLHFDKSNVLDEWSYDLLCPGSIFNLWCEEKWLRQ